MNKLNKINKTKNAYYIVGDFNINVCDNLNSNVQSYIQSIYSLGGCSIIDKPARITSSTATLIDHLYTNNLKNPYIPGILIADISDHLPIFCLIKCNTPRHLNSTYIRDMKNFSVANYVENVQKSLQEFQPQTDPDACINELLSIITTVTNQHAPRRLTTRRKNKLKRKLWLTAGILKSISTKNKLFRLCYKQNKHTLVQKYKVYLNKLNKIKRIAKQQYYENEITNTNIKLTKNGKLSMKFYVETNKQ